MPARARDGTPRGAHRARVSRGFLPRAPADQEFDASGPPCAEGRCAGRLPRPGTSSPGGGGARGASRTSLVDSASSHMLVSKIKPCMSKYKQIVR